MMKESIFYDVLDVMKLLDVAKSKAYKIIAQLNAELTEKGYLVVNGKVSRAYFRTRFYDLDVKNLDPERKAG